MSFQDRLAQHRTRQHQNVELSNLSAPPHSAPVNAGNGVSNEPHGDFSELSAFLAEDDSIQQGIQRVKANVGQLGALRARTLDALGDPRPEEIQRIEELTNETRQALQQLKQRIQRLETTPAKTNVEMRRSRTQLLRAKFMETLQDFQTEEKENRAKVRQRVERQLRIVKPDATKEEIDRVVEGGGQQVFADALTTSTRYGESRLAYNEALTRQQDLRRMEQTLEELGHLFQEMAIAVEKQEDVIDNVETTAAGVTKDTESALGHTKKAVISAISYRKGRWICFWIFFLIVAILALALGLHFGLKKN